MIRKALTLAAFLLTVAAGAVFPASQPVYDIRHAKRLTLAELAPTLAQSRVVVVGELHTEASHHRGQLAVIQALVGAGAKVAVGLEMFRHDSQKALNGWVSGEMAADQFEAIYYDNWNYPWAVYRPIFEYARAQRIAMIGLNVPTSIPRQVAQNGFQSLSAEQRGQLSDVTCKVDAEYMRYIRSAFGAHAHGGRNFTYFCEAQMVWDTAMAVYTLEYLKAHREATVVLLTGVGHARKDAVPRQIRLRAQVPVAVVLPEVAGLINPQTTGLQDADYLLMDLK